MSTPAPAKKRKASGDPAPAAKRPKTTAAKAQTTTPKAQTTGSKAKAKTTGAKAKTTGSKAKAKVTGDEPEVSDEVQRRLTYAREQSQGMTDNETLASVWMLPYVLKLMLKERPTMQPKQGKWSKDEVAKLHEAVKRFANLRDVTTEQVEAFVSQRQPSMTGGKTATDDDKTFYREMAKAVPGRPVSTVRDRLRRDFVPGKRGPWTAEEDKKLVAAVKKLGRKWKKIGEEIDRRPQDVKDRYNLHAQNNAQDKTTLKYSQWTEADDELLIKTVKNVAVSESKDPDDDRFPWTWVAKAFKSDANRLHCRYRWKKLHAVKVPRKVAPKADPWQPVDELELALVLQTHGKTKLAEVDWPLVAVSVRNNDLSAGKVKQHFTAMLRRRFFPKAAEGEAKDKEKRAALKKEHEDLMEALDLPETVGLLVPELELRVSNPPKKRPKKQLQAPTPKSAATIDTDSDDSE